MARVAVDDRGPRPRGPAGAGATRPAYSPRPAAAHTRVLQLQSDAGNAAVRRALAVQRDDPAPVPGLSPPPAPAPPLGRFSPTTAYIRAGRRFDMRYDPTGPRPANGKATVTLNIHVEFKDFDATMMRRPEFRRHRWTAAQRSQFTWPADKQRDWIGKFSTAVSDGWKEKHAFVLDEPGFEKYRAVCDVKVRHVDKAADANTSITAQWVPPGAPRLRSAVKGAAAELDARDVDEPETAKVPVGLVRQIGPFDFNSSELTPTVNAGIDAFEKAVKREQAPGRKFAGSLDDVAFRFDGRASSKGSVAYNRKLGSARANAVMGRVTSDLNFSFAISSGVGKENATEDPSFQRVDAFASKGPDVDVSQNVAAHEAGHMFGLGDEYVEEVPPADTLAKFAGDRATHDADVRAAIGDEAADELLVQTSGSIMGSGSEVKPGHYVYFLEALDIATGHKWKVE
jgi:outer membrane protein OmpA-like peptidoglycan-associated protein